MCHGEVRDPNESKEINRHSEATARTTVGDTNKEDEVDQTCEAGFEARYKVLEQEVRDADPVKKQKTSKKQ